MLGLYVVITVVILCITYAGVEETMRLFAYLDLQLRYAWVRFNKVIKELKKNDRS